MWIKLTAAQLQALQAGRNKPVAPFPLSLMERMFSALLDGVAALARRVVDVMATLFRLPKPA